MVADYGGVNAFEGPGAGVGKGDEGRRFVVGVRAVGGVAFGNELVDYTLDVLPAYSEPSGDLGDGELAGSRYPHRLPTRLGQPLSGCECLAPVAADAGSLEQFSEQCLYLLRLRLVRHTVTLSLV